MNTLLKNARPTMYRDLTATDVLDFFGGAVSPFTALAGVRDSTSRRWQARLEDCLRERLNNPLIRPIRTSTPLYTLV